MQSSRAGATRALYTGAVVTIRERKPSWLRVTTAGGPRYAQAKGTLRQLKLHTVCEEAHCPNLGECWGQGTATVLVLGDVCTRGCRFCAVTSGHPGGSVDDTEPEHVASAVAQLGWRYVVLTMVTRDDLPDGGASHVARTITQIRARSGDVLVEALVGDFQGRFADVEVVLNAGPAVFAHNVEVVRELTRAVRDVRCSYDQSLEVLRYAKQYAPGGLTKSSVMVGAGETDAQVEQTMRDLREVGVDILTLGQYLRPSAKHLPVHRYVEPQQFAAYEAQARALGFRFVASGPLVRSSYRAAELFVRGQLQGA